MVSCITPAAYPALYAAIYVVDMDCGVTLGEIPDSIPVPDSHAHALPASEAALLKLLDGYPPSEAVSLHADHPFYVFCCGEESDAAAVVAAGGDDLALAHALISSWFNGWAA